MTDKELVETLRHASYHLKREVKVAGVPMRLDLAADAIERLAHKDNQDG